MSIATFTQHIPAFVEGYTPKVIEFDTIDDLLNNVFFNHYRETSDNKFSHFAMSENRLMAIYDEGLTWRVVGFIESRERLYNWLPQWKPPIIDRSVPKNEITNRTVNKG